MGSSTTTQTSQAQMTPEERQLQQQQIANNAFMMPYAQRNYSALSDNIFAILSGQQPAAQGIGGINEAQTQSMVNASLRDIAPQFQSAGLTDSGLAYQGGVRAAQDTRNQNAQFNVSAAQNLFNLASGGQSNLQGQYQGSTNSLFGQMGGLRQQNSSSTIFANPFQTAAQLMQGAGSMAGGFSTGHPFCWVASELFGGWYHPKTIMVRFFISEIGPKWFKKFYIKYGETISEFIKNKPILKILLLPFFELFACIGKERLCHN